MWSAYLVVCCHPQQHRCRGDRSRGKHSWDSRTWNARRWGNCCTHYLDSRSRNGRNRNSRRCNQRVTTSDHSSYNGRFPNHEGNTCRCRHDARNCSQHFARNSIASLPYHQFSGCSSVHHATFPLSTVLLLWIVAAAALADFYMNRRCCIPTPLVSPLIGWLYIYPYN